MSPTLPVTNRSRILDAARRLTARREAFTLGEVAAQAHVSRATVHRLFGSRERVIAAAGELLTTHSLLTLSMDAVADRAGVSRANVYRLFPGKPALFREVVRVFSPLEPVRDVVTGMADRPPDEVMPAMARAAVNRLAGRTGIVGSLLAEITSAGDEAEEARLLALTEGVAPVIAYVIGQMQAGRLRPMHPLLAIQSFVGPIAFHLLTRDAAHRLAGYDQPIDEAVDEIVAVWLRGMRPEPGGTT